jgi:hypothetical protein
VNRSLDRRGKASAQDENGRQRVKLSPLSPDCSNATRHAGK